METRLGTLYGIGVGPGDPELITQKAVRLLGQVDVVFTASSTKNRYSLALDIARPHIPETTPVVRLGFPMTADRGLLTRAWRENAETILGRLVRGLCAAYITVGDSLTYSTFGYVIRSLKGLCPEVAVETVPGITAFQAASARINQVLVEGEESLWITSGAKGGQRLREIRPKPENIVFLKAYRNMDDIVSALNEDGRGDTSVVVSRCGRRQERVLHGLDHLDGHCADYWTLVLSKRKTRGA